jgi:hypothetical protein
VQDDPDKAGGNLAPVLLPGARQQRLRRGLLLVYGATQRALGTW